MDRGPGDTQRGRAASGGTAPSQDRQSPSADGSRSQEEASSSLLDAVVAASAARLNRERATQRGGGAASQRRARRSRGPASGMAPRMPLSTRVARNRSAVRPAARSNESDDDSDQGGGLAPRMDMSLRRPRPIPNQVRPATNSDGADADSDQGRRAMGGLAPRMDISLRRPRRDPNPVRSDDDTDDDLMMYRAYMSGGYSRRDRLHPSPVRSERYKRIQQHLKDHARELEQALIRRFFPRSPSPIPPAEYADNASDEDGCFCSICLNTIESPYVRLIDCRHEFHEFCILRSFERKKKRHRSCPLCRGCPNFLQRVRGGKLVHFRGTVPDTGELSDYDKEKVREIPALRPFLTGVWDEEANERTISMIDTAFERYGVLRFGPGVRGYFDFLAAAFTVADESPLYDANWDGHAWLLEHATKPWPPREDAQKEPPRVQGAAEARVDEEGERPEQPEGAVEEVVAHKKPRLSS